MADNVPEKMKTLLMSQRRLANKMPMVASVLFIPPVLFAFGELTILSGIVSFLTAYLISRIILFIHAMRMQRKYYADDVEGFVKDMHAAMAADALLQDAEIEQPSGPKLREFMITVVEKPEKSSSSYKGSPIYEWLVVKMGDGEPTKFEFDGVVNIDALVEKPNLPQGVLVLPPGIMYRQVSTP